MSADNDLSLANQQLATGVAKLRAFLSDEGIAAEETVLQGVRVVDAYAEPYRPAAQAARRYIVETTLLVRSGNPDRVLGVSQKAGELVPQGVVLSTRSDYEESGPTFLFTKRNDDIKPGMSPTRRRGRGKARHSSPGIPEASSAAFEGQPGDSSRFSLATRRPGCGQRARSRSAFGWSGRSNICWGIGTCTPSPRRAVSAQTPAGQAGGPGRTRQGTRRQGVRSCDYT